MDSGSCSGYCVLTFVYRKDKPRAAKQVVRKIFSAAKTIALHPNIGRPGRTPNTREFIVTGTPFIVPYRVQKGALEVLRVLHGAMEGPEKVMTKSLFVIILISVFLSPLR